MTLTCNMGRGGRSNIINVASPPPPPILQNLIFVYTWSDPGSCQIDVDYDWLEMECPEENTPMMVTQVGFSIIQDNPI